MTMAPISDLVDELKSRLVTYYFDETSVNETLANFVTYFDQHKRPFGGSVYREASLMGLTALYMMELRGWTDSQENFVTHLTGRKKAL